MNSYILTLNQWGEHAVRFAWPMLWQSSLLIGLLYGFEWGCRRKLRAGARYALWLVLLAKLVLPPSLSLPTAPSWWLWTSAAPPPTPLMAVTYGADSGDGLPGQLAATTAMPSPIRLSLEALVLAVWLTGSVGLLGWLLVRWRQVMREARSGADAPAWLGALLEETRRSAGVGRPVRLRLLDKAVSPAVCGLVRPVVLVPRALATGLSSAQARAILWHELVHLRRGDVWVNCFQTLLQLAYWWHPFLWLANARIRRVREEAVDDAVMLALRDEAECYAPTLLAVARLALHRPLASLGLVGILESQRALRQRIERLMDFCPPRKKGVTLASALCVLGFGAFAVPMGQGPGKANSAQVETASVAREPEPIVKFTTNALTNVAGATGGATPAPNVGQPQIQIKTKFIALPDEAAAEFWKSFGVTKAGTNSTTILTPAQAKAALNTFQSNSKTELISELAMTTLSGRQAQLQCVELSTVVAKLNPKAFAPPGVSTNSVDTNGLYLTETLPLGPTLDMVPSIGSDGGTIELTLLANVSEFLGYDQPSNSVAVYVAGVKQHVPPPLPRFHVSSINQTVAVGDGDTVVLGGLSSEKVSTLKSKVPVLGDVPLLGRLFRSESRSVQKKQMMVFVTPTLIDATGNRIHSEK